MGPRGRRFKSCIADHFFRALGNYAGGFVVLTPYSFYRSLVCCSNAHGRVILPYSCLSGATPLDLQLAAIAAGSLSLLFLVTTLIYRQRASRLAQHYQSSEQLLQSELAFKSAALEALQVDVQQLTEKEREQSLSATALRTQLAVEQSANQEKIALLAQSEARLKEQFENLANRIFDSKAQQFDQQSQQRLAATFAPLKDQLGAFRQQVQSVYETEAKERHTLKAEILSLKQLNERMSEDALNLTKALKGDSKQQGNWGEVVLARVLEQSGLRQGHEYSTEVSQSTDDGKRYRPDVIVHLPEGKQIIIDSKVSLTAYEQYFNSDDDVERQAALTAHVQSLRNHIKGLGAKDYQALPGIHSLDYVLMFIPIEAAFLTALDQQPDLVKLALDNNIMLVSPTNLLVALRTVNNIWRYEYQNQNAKLIADKAAAMYDKLRLFVDELQKLGKGLEQAQLSYETSLKRLASGRGNLLSQAEGLRDLGVTAKKAIDPEWLQQKGVVVEKSSDNGAANGEMTRPVASERSANDE
ncbi:DNA recombination protein RmuC [Corallincola holothuriorum]|uniref:DNA recombination protein RmuC n=1 Tax=Corallincola holothuriorum TaxID=2282215 RepID=A0A368N5J7_9GAMM|nr:DNA recombination protein RmuC [Corallincola holothuriorum]